MRHSCSIIATMSREITLLQSKEFSITELEEYFQSSNGISAPLLEVLSQYEKYGELTEELYSAEQEYIKFPTGKNAQLVTGLQLKLRDLGDQMLYPNYIVWLLYKNIAYNDGLEINQKLNKIERNISAAPVNNWNDLLKHALKKDYICGRRLHFLAIQLAKYRKNEVLVSDLSKLDPWKLDFESHKDTFLKLFPSNASISELVSSNELISSFDKDTQEKWVKLEFSKQGKWQDYPTGRLEQKLQERAEALKQFNSGNLLNREP